jgi:hypothetical protein
MAEPASWLALLAGGLVVTAKREILRVGARR